IQVGGCQGLRFGGGIAQQGVGQGFQAGLAGNLGARAPFRLVGGVQIFQPLLAVGLQDLRTQGIVELALARDGVQDRHAAAFQFADVEQAHFQLAQDRVVQSAGGLLAVAGDERHSGAGVQQIHGRRNLGGAGVEFRRQQPQDAGGIDGMSLGFGTGHGHVCRVEPEQAAHFAIPMPLRRNPWRIILGLTRIHAAPRIMFSDELAGLFGPDGPLARQLPGYVPRAAQLALSEAIRDTLEEGGVLIAEAGTGTGKTWAYLAPAFLSGGKVLVSTGTRTLQDQLFRRDIPRLREALALPVDVALLKGRGNYVCHYHLERLEQDERALKSRDEMPQLRAIRRFVRESDTGDRADLPEVPETADIWNRVTSTRENCLGQDCPYVRDCFLLKARRHAQEADVVVVNHALFMADLALREEGVTDLLPETQLVVFDEAHQLPDTATRFLGQSLSLHQVLDCARQAEAAGLAHAREAFRWSDLCQALD